MKSITVHYALLLLIVLSAAVVSSFQVNIPSRRLVTIRSVDALLLSEKSPEETTSEETSGSSSSITENNNGPNVKCPNCDLCDGSGRVAGGIGAIFSWIPIKAYRPCPTYIERGGMYQRSGQSLDEIAFGRKDRF